MIALTFFTPEPRPLLKEPWDLQILEGNLSDLDVRCGAIWSAEYCSQT